MQYQWNKIYQTNSQVWSAPRIYPWATPLILFADDSNLFTSGKDIKSIEKSIMEELPTLIDWLQANRLSLNVKKMHIMIFGPKND